MAYELWSISSWRFCTGHRTSAFDNSDFGCIDCLSFWVLWTFWKGPLYRKLVKFSTVSTHIPITTNTPAQFIERQIYHHDNPKTIRGITDHIIVRLKINPVPLVRSNIPQRSSDDWRNGILERCEISRVS